MNENSIVVMIASQKHFWQMKSYLPVYCELKVWLLGCQLPCRELLHRSRVAHAAEPGGHFLQIYELSHASDQSIADRPGTCFPSSLHRMQGSRTPIVGSQHSPFRRVRNLPSGQARARPHRLLL